MIRSKITALLAVVLMALAVVGTSLALLNPQAVETLSATRVKEYEDKLFNENTLMEFNILVDEDDWQELLDNALAEEYIPVDVQINGVTFKEVGLRAKGNSSLSGVTNDRYSLKVEFDHYIDGQTCYGLDKLALNNNYQDPTSMKEYLSFDMLRFMDVPSSLCSYAKVSVNGEYWGLYLAIECPEESYMERNYGSDYGNLYKPDNMEMNGGEKGGMQPPGNGEQQPPAPGAAPAANGGQNGEKDNENAVDAAASASVKGETTPPGGNQDNSPPSPLNVPTDGGAQNTPPSEDGQTDGAQNTENARDRGEVPGGGGGMGRGTGATGLTDQGDDIDSYSDIFDSAVFDITDSDKQRLVEAIQNLNAGTDLEKYVDVDEVLRYFAVNTVLVNLDSYASNMKHNYYLYEKDGQLAILPWDYNLAFGAFQAGSAESAVNFPIDTPVSGATLEDSPLIGKLLEVDEYKEKYHEYLRQIVDEYFSSGYFEKTIDRINTLITKAVATDPTAFYSYDEYTAAVEALKVYGKLRAESIKGQLDGTVPATQEAQQADPEALIDASAVDLSALGQQGGGKGGEKGFGGRNAQPAPETETGQEETAEGGETQGAPAGGERPFGDMPDMKLMRQAMEIIGDTELQDLTDEQKAKLSDLGLSDEELESFTAMQADLPQGGFGNRGAFGQQAQDQTDWKSTALLLGISGILLIGGVVFAFCFRRRR